MVVNDVMVTLGDYLRRVLAPGYLRRVMEKDPPVPALYEHDAEVLRAWEELGRTADVDRLLADARFVLESQVDSTSQTRVHIKAGDCFTGADPRWEALLANGAGWINLSFVAIDDDGIVITAQRSPDQVPPGVDATLMPSVTWCLGRVVSSDDAR